jgi:acetyl/propionyl-CoA carboxylase alpha subunit
LQITGTDRTFEGAAHRLTRALTESRIRGVKTNIPFLLNLLRHNDFLKGVPTTRFIEEHPELMQFPMRRNRANKVGHAGPGFDDRQGLWSIAHCHPPPRPCPPPRCPAATRSSF